MLNFSFRKRYFYDNNQEPFLYARKISLSINDSILLWKLDLKEEYEVYLENFEPTICNTDGINNKQYNDYYYFKNILNSKIEEICKMRNVHTLI